MLETNFNQKLCEARNQNAILTNIIFHNKLVNVYFALLTMAESQLF